jgi:hypothetical protein
MQRDYPLDIQDDMVEDWGGEGWADARPFSGDRRFVRRVEHCERSVCSRWRALLRALWERALCNFALRKLALWEAL